MGVGPARGVQSVAAPRRESHHVMGTETPVGESKKISNSPENPLSLFTVRGWLCRHGTILLLSLLLRGP
jgi:hypothetical protein